MGRPEVAKVIADLAGLTVSKALAAALTRKRTIRHNKAQCLECDWVVTSSVAGNGKSCPCGKLYVYGGHEFTGREATGEYRELTEYAEETPLTPAPGASDRTVGPDGPTGPSKGLSKRLIRKRK